MPCQYTSWQGLPHVPGKGLAEDIMETGRGARMMRASTDEEFFDE